MNSVLGTVMKAEDESNKMSKKDKELKTVGKLFRNCAFEGEECVW